MRKRTWFYTTLLSTLLLLSAGLAQAQGPAPAPQAPLGSAFTYQGQLKDGGGSPVSSTCDFTFSLWDAASGGAQIGSDSAVTGVSVSDGYFAAEVNAGGEFGSDAFTGEARWLQIAVQCTGDANPITLDPRQPLSAAPYAHYAEEVGPHDHWGESWRGSDTGLILSGGTVGLEGSGSSRGLYGHSDASSGYGQGVFGQSTADQGAGIIGWASATSGENHGAYGRSFSSQGTGVYGWASAASGSTCGVYGLSDSPSGQGVHGEGGAYAVHGHTSGGSGVFGHAAASSGIFYGVYGRSDSSAGRGLYGLAAAGSGTTYGVYGSSSSPDGTGVYGSAPTYGLYGLASAASGTTYGVYAASSSPDGYGAYGSAPTYGLYGLASAVSGTTYGVYGQSDSSYGYGVYGTGPRCGVYGYASYTSGSAYGVYGETNSFAGYGVYGYASRRGVVGQSTEASGYAIYGISGGGGYAGYFSGDVHVQGTLSKTGGSFQIDHPLDPAGQYLYHSFVESPDMMNIYNGNVVLDADGTAWVEMPAWFEALNGGEEYRADVRYQLTPVGAAMPNLHIAEKIQGNRFRIAGGVPGLEVSWLVTGIRHDPWAEENRIPVEQAKPAGERGTYLYPELYGQPEELGLDYQRNQLTRDPATPEEATPETMPE